MSLVKKCILLKPRKKAPKDESKMQTKTFKTWNGAVAFGGLGGNSADREIRSQSHAPGNKSHNHLK